jgi:hypothetical protein
MSATLYHRHHTNAKPGQMGARDATRLESRYVFFVLSVFTLLNDYLQLRVGNENATNGHHHIPTATANPDNEDDDGEWPPSPTLTPSPYNTVLYYHHHIVAPNNEQSDDNEWHTPHRHHTNAKPHQEKSQNLCRSDRLL